MRDILIVTLASDVSLLVEELRLVMPDYEVNTAVLRHNDSLTISENTIAVPLFVYEGELYRSVVNKLYGALAMPPLIYDKNSFQDVKTVVGGDEGTIYCVHNTELELAEFMDNDLLWKTGEDVDRLIADIKCRGLKEVVLQPLMLERGFHYKRDVLGVLQPELEKAGIGTISGKGLMEYTDVRKLIIKRIVNFK